MDSSAAKPAKKSLATTTVDQVYNLEVLVETMNSGKTRARAANLQLSPIEAATVREALSSVVNAAKELIRGQASSTGEIPWLPQPDSPKDNETRFLVPLHL